MNSIMPDGSNPDASEVSKNVVLFTPEQRKNLERNGYVIYRLTGQTIPDLKAAGNFFIPSSYMFNNKVARSMTAEVAINPKSLYLKDSQSKTLKEQMKMMEEHAKSIRKKFPGLTAILGGAPDYAELAFQHLKTTGIYLFGGEDGSPEADISSPRACTTSFNGQDKTGIYYATVGIHDEFQGLGVGSRKPDERWGEVYAAPLIVSASVKNHDPLNYLLAEYLTK